MTTMQATAPQAWMTGWTPDKPVDLDYMFVKAGTPYVAGPVPGFLQRDLGLTAASRGKLSAKLVRLAGKPGEAFSDWRAFDVDFHFFYIWKGSAKLQNESGQNIALDRGVAAWQPALLRHRLYDFSSDFEMFEMFGPADPRMIIGRNAALPDRAGSLAAGRKGQYLYETPETFVRGAGPRKFFLYRDLGTRGPTDGRIHIHIVHATETLKGTGGTGWHKHTMQQLFWVFDGSAGFTVDGHKEVQRVVAGDGVCISAGTIHNVPDIEADYKLIEVCIPADYDTFDAPAPK